MKNIIENLKRIIRENPKKLRIVVVVSVLIFLVILVVGLNSLNINLDNRNKAATTTTNVTQTDTIKPLTELTNDQNTVYFTSSTLKQGTLSFWYKTSVPMANFVNRRLVDINPDPLSKTTSIFRIWINNGKLTTFIGNNKLQSDFILSEGKNTQIKPVQINEYHLISVTWNVNKISMWLDNNVVASQTFSNANETSYSSIVMGNLSSFNNATTSLTSDLVISNLKLFSAENTNTDITNLYNLGSANNTASKNVNILASTDVNNNTIKFSPTKLSDGTISFWLKTSASLDSNVNRRLIDINADTSYKNTPAIFRIWINNGKLTVSLGSEKIQADFDFATGKSGVLEPVKPNEWHLVTFTWNSTYKKLFLLYDGGLITTSSWSGINQTIYSSMVFNNTTNIKSSDGSIQADVSFQGTKLYSPSITQPEVDRIYKNDLTSRILPIEAYLSTDLNTNDVSRLEVIEGQPTNLHIKIKTQVAISTGGKIMISTPHSNQNVLNSPSVLQSNKLSNNDYLTATWPTGVSGSIACKSFERFGAISNCQLTIDKGNLKKGDQITISIKNFQTSIITVSTKDTYNYVPFISVDTGLGTPTGGMWLAISKQPTIANMPISSGLRTLLVRVPSTIKVGQSFSAHIWVEGPNQEPDFSTALTFNFGTISGLQGLPSTYQYKPDKYGSTVINNLVFQNKPVGNDFKLVINNISIPSIAYSSNPFEVITDSNANKLYWGDLHNHSILSDGEEDPINFYPFAQSRALDFAALTDHVGANGQPNASWEVNNTLSQKDWSKIQSLNTQADKPGQFVPFLAFEYSHGGRVDNCSGANWPCTGIAGDWNVIYSNLQSPLLASDFLTGPSGMYSKVRQVDPNAILIPHFGGRMANYSLISGKNNTDPELALDRAMTPVIETISDHESTINPSTNQSYGPRGFEDWAVNALNNYDLKFGFVGSSDDHSTHPGRSVWNGKMGIMAVWSDNLDRASILDAIKKRHTYAYSHGNRPIIKVTGNNNSMMGDEITLKSATEARNFHISVTTQSEYPVNKIELKKNGTVINTIPNNTQQLNGVLKDNMWNYEIDVSDKTTQDYAYYYTTIYFSDSTRIAETSPIWINVPKSKINGNTSPNNATDSVDVGGDKKQTSIKTDNSFD